MQIDQMMRINYPGMKIIKTLKAGDYFGEIYAEYRVHRTATILCKTDCEFAVLDNQHYYMYV